MKFSLCNTKDVSDIVCNKRAGCVSNKKNNCTVVWEIELITKEEIVFFFEIIT